MANTPTLLKSDMITRIAEQASINESAVKKVLAAQESVISDALKEGLTVKFYKLFTVRPVTRSARLYFDHREGVRKAVDERKGLRLRVSQSFRNELNG